MPITAGDLIEGRTPVWTTLDAPILMALMVMQKHDFSQLPIVDDRGRQLGIVTAERILRTQRRYGAPLDTLLVDNAATKAVVVAPDDRLSDVFDLFGKHPAVLVVDSEQVLMGIITPWDAAFHLQQRAEDMMLIEDIEKSLKEHIRASYSDAETGKLDTVAWRALSRTSLIRLCAIPGGFTLRCSGFSRPKGSPLHTRRNRSLTRSANSSAHPLPPKGLTTSR